MIASDDGKASAQWCGLEAGTAGKDMHQDEKSSAGCTSKPLACSLWVCLFWHADLGSAAGQVLRG